MPWPRIQWSNATGYEYNPQAFHVVDEFTLSWLTNKGEPAAELAAF